MTNETMPAEVRANALLGSPCAGRQTGAARPRSGRRALARSPALRGSTEAVENDMNDRELLKLAAKAAGVVFTVVDEYGVWFEAPDKELGKGVFFNPLTDDGDALRLAVKLHLLVHVNAYMPAENAWGHVAVAWHGQREEFRSERFTDDPFKATRRAIVRAAAEIGKALPLNANLGRQPLLHKTGNST